MSNHSVAVDDEHTTMDDSSLKELPRDSFSCKHCDRSYRSKGGLSKHVKVHHHEEWEQENGRIFCHECSAK